MKMNLPKVFWELFRQYDSIKNLEIYRRENEKGKTIIIFRPDSLLNLIKNELKPQYVHPQPHLSNL